MNTARSSVADRLRVTRPWQPAGLAVAAALLGGLVVLPLFRLFSVAAEEFPAAGGGAGPAAWNTLWTAVVVTAMAIGAGAGAALVTERMLVPMRRWLRIGLLAPLLVPPFVSALSWARAYGPGGLSEDVVGATIPGLFGPAGVVLVITVHVMPLAYLVTAAALSATAEPDLERAARISGAGPAATLFDVTLPLLRPALVGGAALVFVASINSFGIPAILGIRGGFFTITTRIYQDLAFAASPVAFSRAVLLASALVVTALVVVGLADLLTGGLKALTRAGAPAGPAATPSTRGRVAAAALWAYLAATSGIPLVALVLTALTRAVGLSPAPQNWTLANLRHAMSGPYVGALGRSMVLAITAATLVVGLGALLVALRRGRAGRSLGTLALLTFAVPGSTLAVAIILSYGRWFRDTLFLILIAYLAKFWALGHRTLAGSADSIAPDSARAARVSGAGPLVALRTVVAPLMRPAVAAAWLLVFLFGIHELTMSSLLYGPGTDTLAVVVLNLQQLGDDTVTSALAVLMTVPVLAGAVLLLAWRGPSTRLMGLE